MKIAVFGDVHGRLNLMSKIVHRWQQEHEESLDAILQVGDLELTLSLSINPSLPCPLYFVAGNHEDYDLLEEYKNPSFLDANKSIMYLPNGSEYAITKEDEIFTIVGLGGIHKGQRPGSISRDPRIAFNESDLDKILDCKKKPCVFLSHIPPTKIDFKSAEDIDIILELIQPQYHFFGHTHRSHISHLGETKIYGLTKLDFKGRMLRRNCVGILDTLENKFSFISEDWLRVNEQKSKYIYQTVASNL